MKSKLTLFILMSLLLSSCATYTISEAREIISYQGNKNLPSTKYSEILEEEERKEREKREAVVREDRVLNNNRLPWGK